MLSDKPDKRSIIYQGKALNLWKEKKDIEKTGNCMRFLSRLWWFDGNRKQAEYLCGQAIEVLDNQPSFKSKSNGIEQYVAVENAFRSIRMNVYSGEKRRLRLQRNLMMRKCLPMR